MSFDTHFSAKLVIFSAFGKTQFFFEKKQTISFQKTQISYVIEKFSISVAFYSKLAILCWEKCSKSERQTSRIFNFSTSDIINRQVNVKKNVPVERMIFVSYLNIQ